MTDKYESLDRLRALRESYRAYVEAVDADLAREKAKRLAARQGEILEAVAESAARGASLADIKRAYGTKDHRTIKKMVDSMSNQIEAIAEEIAAPVATERFTIDVGALGIPYLTVDGITFMVVLMDEDGYMLDAADGWTSTVGGLYDGMILDAQSTGLAGEIYRALREAEPND